MLGIEVQSVFGLLDPQGPRWLTGPFRGPRLSFPKSSCGFGMCRGLKEAPMSLPRGLYMYQI